MKKTLLTLASILFATNVYAQTLYEKLSPYLENGKPKQEFLVDRYLFAFRNEVVFNEAYLIEDKPLILQHSFAPFTIFNLEEGTYSKPISKNPYVIIYDGRNYSDASQDRINGNEAEILEDKVKKGIGL